MRLRVATVGCDDQVWRVCYNQVFIEDDMLKFYIAGSGDMELCACFKIWDYYVEYSEDANDKSLC